MAEDSHRYPPGMKPFKSATEKLTLDTVWDLARDNSYTVSIVVPQGTTRRQAMLHLHHRCSHVIKKLQSDADNEHLRLLEERTTRKAFFDAINLWRDEDLPHLGLEDGSISKPNLAKIRETAEKTYTETIIKVRESARDEQDREKRGRRKKQKN